MSAHHHRHAITCPCHGSQGGIPLDRCTCGAPGSTAAKERALAMSPAELVDQVNAAGAMTPRAAERTRARNLVGRRTVVAGIDIPSNATHVGAPPLGTEIEVDEGPACPACNRRGGELVRPIGMREVRCSLCAPGYGEWPTPDPDPEPDPVGGFVSIDEDGRADVVTTEVAPPSSTAPPGGEIDADAIDAALGLSDEQRRDVRIGETVSMLLGRRVHIGSVPRRWNEDSLPRKLVVSQRCAACRADITSHVTEQPAELATVGDVGQSARLSYQRHQCKPATQDLKGASTADLAQLEQDLDYELDRIGKRLVEIRTLAGGDARASKRST